MKKVSIGLAMALSLVACKKKKEEETKEPAPMTQEGSAPAGSAAMAGSGSAAAAPAEKPLVGAEMADRYKECTGLINDGKLDDFTSKCVDANYVGHMADEPNEMKGPDSIKGQFAMVRGAFPDMKMSPQLILISGKNILAVALSQGTNDGPLKFPGMPETPATKKKIGYMFFHHLAINDQNKATEEWMYEDPTTMVGQLGLLPKGAPPVRPVMDKGWDGAPVVAVTADNDTEKKNLATAKAMVDAFNAHKVADWLALATDDVVESDQADAKDFVGKKAVEQDLKGFQAAFPDGKLTVDGSWAAGDYVVSQGTFEGTNTGDMGPVKKTGKKATIHYAEIMKLKDGKVSNVWRFRNGMATAMQLGLMQPPGAGAGSAAAGSAAPKK